MVNLPFTLINILNKKKIVRWKVSAAIIICCYVDIIYFVDVMAHNFKILLTETFQIFYFGSSEATLPVFVCLFAYQMLSLESKKASKG